MAKNTISMKKFRSSLTKISRLAKTGYNSITSVAKSIISTVTSIASKISLLSDSSEWQQPSQSLSSSNYSDYYDSAASEEEQFLKRSLSNLTNYKDEVIFDIFTIRDAASSCSEQISDSLISSLKSSFNEASADFFLCGKQSGESFGGGFEETVRSSIETVMGNIQATIQQVNSMASSVNSGYSNVTYSSPSYNFYGSGQTVSEQINEARVTDTINSLRGN